MLKGKEKGIKSKKRRFKGKKKGLKKRKRNLTPREVETEIDNIKGKEIIKKLRGKGREG